MSRRLSFVALLSLAAAFPTGGRAQGADATPAYQLVLHSRTAQATPDKTKTSQTGGGSITVEQPTPNTVVFRMGGSAAAGSTCHCSNAEIAFELMQDIEVVAARDGVRPPRIGMIGRLVGTLQVSDPEKWKNAQGSAMQGPPTACLLSCDQPLLTIDMPASAVACGQKLSINNQSGPCESSATVGCYRLSASFRVAANQGKGVWHRQYAVADFDPAPQLDAFWADGLKTFRAVPREDFGFTLVVRVVEDTTATVVTR